MNYFDVLKAADTDKTAIIEDGISYTYGELIELVVSMGNRLQNEIDLICTTNDMMIGHIYRDDKTKRIVYIIKEDTIMQQLIKFLACNAIGIIPLIVPKEMSNFSDFNISNIPKQACMAVMTSGSSGTPKILYRTFESWADFFPVQNKVFGMNKNSKLFVHGSLAFTGNLNLYMAQFYLGAVIVAENKFNPRRWIYVIEKESVNAIYLIPAKLMLLLQVKNGINKNIKSILSGSQSLGKAEAQSLKKIFPKAEIILYYGASELNYITYVKDINMTDAKNLVGKPFPNVSLFVKNGEIYVNTKYHAEGIICPYSLSDRGYLDDNGNLYFEGRSDDIVLIRGRKISLIHIENALESLNEIEEAAVFSDEEKIIALVTITDKLYLKDKKLSFNDVNLNLELKSTIKKDIFNKLRKSLAHFEMPCKILVIGNMPHNESGKKDKNKLMCMMNLNSIIVT